jgi:hypothetical protein
VLVFKKTNFLGGVQMWKKVALLFPLLMFLVVSNAFAQWVVWDNAAGTGLWSDQGNWYGEGGVKPILPTGADIASISISSPCTVDSSTNAACDLLYVGFDVTAGTLNMTGGSIDVSHNGNIGMASNGTLNMSDGYLRISTGSPLYSLWVGSTTGNGIINITGGTIDVLAGGWLVVSSKGHIHLDGGVIQGAGGWSIDEGGTIDISGGALRFIADGAPGAGPAALAYFASGRITAYNGEGIIAVDYDTAAMVTTITAVRVNKSCQNGYYLPGDVNKDCSVDFKDLASIIQNWLKCNDYSRAECVSFYSR